MGKKIAKSVKLESTDHKAQRFWEGSVSKKTLTLRWGKLGTCGRNKISEFGTNAEAINVLETAVRGKLKTGYAIVASHEDEENKFVELSEYEKKLLALLCRMCDSISEYSMGMAPAV